jgi:hypothetical protein
VCRWLTSCPSLNSGAFAGEARDILEMLVYMKNKCEKTNKYLTRLLLFLAFFALSVCVCVCVLFS